MAPKTEIVVALPLEPKIIQTNEEAIVLLNQTFKDDLIMIEIAKCESGLRQWSRDGSTLRGGVNPKDLGIFQINEDYHLQSSQKLGHDIYSAEGNIAYAKLLYEEQGTTPWSASKECWK